jgi:queuine/archaeosine tRNA-ribosyltransferase
MKLVYLPGTGSVTYYCWTKYNMPVWGAEKSYCKYKHFLLNYYYAKDLGEDLIKKVNEVGGIHFTDSGGYQQFSLRVNLNPKDVILVQQKLSEYGIILDCPPYFFKGTFTADFDADNFNSYLEKTKRNTEIMFDNIYRKDFKLYGVIHGADPVLQMEWYKSMKKDFDFYGWCISLKPPPDVYGIAKLVLQANYFGIRNLHIFGVGGYTKLRLLYYLKTIFDDEFDLVTYDSTTCYQKAKNRTYNYFKDNKLDSVYIGVKSKDRVTQEMPDCDCPLCNSIDRSIFKSSSALGTEYLHTHNLNMLVRYLEYLEQNNPKRHPDLRVEKLVSDFRKDKSMIMKFKTSRLVKLF